MTGTPVAPCWLTWAMKKALVAVAHTLLVMCYEVLKKGEAYHELGADYLDKLEPERRTKELIEELPIEELV